MLFIQCCSVTGANVLSILLEFMFVVVVVVVVVIVVADPNNENFDSAGHCHG